MEKLTQKEVWNNIALDWKEFRQKPRKEVIEFLNECGGNLLDIGCGSGRHFLRKEGLKVFGVDFSEKMIELAKQNVEKENLSLELKLMEDKIPYSNEYFDNFICIAVLHCIETKKRRIDFLREIVRVLKKEGKGFLEVWSRNQKRVKNREKDSFIPWTARNQKFNRYYYLYDLEELKKELESVGFKILEIKEKDNIEVLVEKI